MKKRKKRKEGRFGVYTHLELEVPPTDRAFFCRLFHLKKLETVKLACGSEIRFRLATRTRFAAVVVRVKNLNRLQGKGLELAVWDGVPSLCARNPTRNMWDVYFVQG